MAVEAAIVPPRITRPHLHFTSLTPRDLCGDIVETSRLAVEKLGYSTSYADRYF